MTETYFDNVTCSCCGHVNLNEFYITSSISFDCDLDGRDDSIDLKEMSLWVHQCEKCGFATECLDDEIVYAKETIKTERYKTCDGLLEGNGLAQLFVKNAILHEVNPEAARMASYAYKHASWVCDDEGKVELANELRRRAVALLEKDKDNWNIRDNLYAADMLRRAGEFQRVIDMLSKYEYEEIEDGYAFVVNFLLEKAMEGDTERYCLDHSSNEINPRPVPAPKESLRERFDKELEKLAKIKARLNNDV